VAGHLKMRNCDIILGYECNNNCMHCIRGGKDRKINFSTEEVINILDEAKKRGVMKIILQGGEPTIRKDFFELINEVKKRDFYLQIQSNGRMFSNKEFALESSKYIDEVCISVHNLNEKHDSFTRSESFKQTINGIKNIKTKIKILVIITKYNVNDLKEIIDYINELPIDFIQIGLVNPEGNALKNNLMPSLDKVKRSISELEIKKDYAFQDLPKCIVKDHVLEDNLPEAEKIYPEEHVKDSESLRKSKKCKSENCRECKHFDSCEGIYIYYLRELTEFLALSNSKKSE
jgi:MoaA/NifB/PqqE/SkfB family radical SAM enzyme